MCALSWLGAGLAVPGRLLGGPRLLDWLTRVAFGSVAICLLILGLGRVGLLDRWLLVGLTTTGALAGACSVPKLVQTARGARVGGRLAAAMLAAGSAALVLEHVASTARPTSADDL